jgi:carbonic anhydrase/acetyltransferase-like protein (isoleucine patch superfamily)
VTDAAPRPIGPPQIAATAFIHPRASVCGEVIVGEHASIWGGAILRGDRALISIGAESNIQDLTMVHADPGIPTQVGARVTVGHRAILHGCTIDDDVLIGMGAILLNRCHIGRGSIVGAGALIPEGVTIPPRSLVLGVPGRVMRETTPDELQKIAASFETYKRVSSLHRSGTVVYHTGSDL